MAITNYKDVVDAELNGQTTVYTFRKSPSQVTTAGLWFDISMSPGNPAAKMWFDATPLTAAQITKSADGGLNHGQSVSPYKKYLRDTTFMTPTTTALPMSIYICDYLMYYPTIDESTTDVQNMVNSVSLPRYIDGLGVQIIAVSLGGRTGGQSFRVSYTNSDGVSGRTTVAAIENNSAALGTIVTSSTATNGSCGPFLPLQEGDKGVRSIESVTMLGADTSFFSLILVKPLVTTVLNEIRTPVVQDYLLTHSLLPEIKDNAFLSFICIPNGSLAATVLSGDIKVIWS